MISDCTAPVGGLYIIWLGPRVLDAGPTPTTETHYYYAGRSCRCSTRWGQHHRALLREKHKNPHMQAVFNKHKVFTPEMLLVVEPESEQIRVEQAWLNEHFGNPGCVNLSDFADTGWNRGRKHTEVTKAKLRGRTHTSETRKYLSDIAKGRPLTDAHRRAIAKGHRGMVPTSRCVVAATQANRNRAWTEEMRAHHAKVHTGLDRSAESVKKQRETWKACPKNVEQAKMLAEKNRLQKGSRKSEEACLKLSEAAKRRWASDEARQDLSNRAKGRVGMTNGVTYKMVKPDAVQAHIDLGWRQGRPKK